MEKVAGKSVVKPELLPPPTDSSKYHIFQIFHQIQTWLGHSLNPLECGMVPMFTDQIPAPLELLTYVRCGCKKDECGTLTCFCKKHGKAIISLSNLLSVEFYFVSRANL